MAGPARRVGHTPPTMPATVPAASLSSVETWPAAWQGPWLGAGSSAKHLVKFELINHGSVQPGGTGSTQSSGSSILASIPACSWRRLERPWTIDRGGERGDQDAPRAESGESADSTDTSGMCLLHPFVQRQNRNACGLEPRELSCRHSVLRCRRKGKPFVRRGRKATGLLESAGSPNRLPHD